MSTAPPIFLIWLLALLPVLLTPLIAAASKRPNLRETLSIGTGVLLFAGICLFIAPVMNGLRPSVTLLTVLPGAGLEFTLEPLGMIFALVAAGLWPLTTLFACGYMRGNNEHAQTRFYIFFALAIAAAIGIAFAGNLLTLYIFYELLTLSTYPLVTHKGDDAARRSGRFYLGILFLTSIGFLLPAIVVTWLVSGTTAFVPGGVLAGHMGVLGATVLYVLFLYGTGKAALMPFHRWLPEAMVAPTPVSALLHAVAVVKAGVFSVLKITVYTFGLGYLSSHDAANIMMWIAAITLLTSSVIALTRDNLKARLAYSTISQLSYIVLGATMASVLGILGGGLHIVTHAVGKITLFFCAGAIHTAAHKSRVSELDGLGRAMPWTFGAFLIASLSIIGLPPMGGLWSKWLLFGGAAESGHLILIGVLAISTVLNIAYLLPIPVRAFLRGANTPQPEHGEAPWQCVLPLCLTAVGCIVLFFAAQPIVAFLRTALEGTP